MQKKEPIVPRGIRNNNPLNIRIGNVWLGEVSHPTDPQFEQFVHIRYGIRAAFVLLRRYIRHYHRDTVPMIISAWAPASENATETYIDKVCHLCDIQSTTIIKYENRDLMCSLVAAMALIECGQPIKEEDIIAGYDMA